MMKISKPIVLYDYLDHQFVGRNEPLPIYEYRLGLGYGVLKASNLLRLIYFSQSSTSGQSVTFTPHPSMEYRVLIFLAEYACKDELPLNDHLIEIPQMKRSAGRLILNGC
jgi:hypothetical protein